MADTLPKTDSDEASLVARLFDATSRQLKDCHEVMRYITEVMDSDRAQREADTERRIELAQLEQDTAIVCEMFARQSKYLAKTITDIEQRSGVALSPTDLLAGIINGLEQSNINLHYFGTREEVADVVQAVIEQGLFAVKERNSE